MFDMTFGKCDFRAASVIALSKILRSNIDFFHSLSHFLSELFKFLTNKNSWAYKDPIEMVFRSRNSLSDLFSLNYFSILI